MKIAVTGATGQLGSLVINALKARVPVAEIVALVRTPAKAANLGVSARTFDYSKPETLPAALAGIDALLLISSNEIGQRGPQHRNVIEAAKKAGVPWIVYTSLLHADTSAITALSGEHLDTEAALKASGIDYTLLRNGWYTENYTGSVPGAVQGGAFLGSAGQGRISSAARADYAEAAAVVLTTPGHKNKTYELAGDTAYTLTDLVSEISRQTGKNIPYKNLPEAEYAKILEGFGLPVPLATAFASFDTGAAQDALYENGGQLAKLLAHPTTTLADAVAAALKA
ncbi:SDR family oxidoreductase [Telmatobacter bradus]|uniref:SDR family oxidoreductase n=1 Tax=Telmatobacter bradus TaxID=474953 RepID=UPI003B4360BF